MTKLIVLMLPDAFAHRRFFTGMPAFPPLKIMKIAAKLFRSALQVSDLKSFYKRVTAYRTLSRIYVLGFDCAVPGNATVALLV